MRNPLRHRYAVCAVDLAGNDVQKHRAPPQFYRYASAERYLNKSNVSAAAHQRSFRFEIRILQR